MSSQNTSNIRFRYIVSGLLLFAVCGERSRADPVYSKKQFLAALEFVRKGSEITGEGKCYDSVKEILRNGDRTLPWLIEKLDDNRERDYSMEIPNSGPDAFEEFSIVGPPLVSDAV